MVGLFKRQVLRNILWFSFAFLISWLFLFKPYFAMAIEVSPDNIQININVSNVAQQYVYTISVAASSGSGEDGYTASSSEPWVTLSGATGNLPSTITITIDTSKLPPSFFTSMAAQSATIKVVGTIHGVTSDQDKEITVTANPVASQSLQVSPSTLNLTVPQGATDVVYNYTISVTSMIDTKYTATVDQPWIRLSPSSGNVPGSLNVEIDVSNLQPSNTPYQGTVTIIGSTGASESVTITVNMPSTTGIISVAPSSITLNVPSGATKREYHYTLSVTGITGKDFTALVNQPWMSINPASGTIPADIELTIDISNLTPGESYIGTVTFTTSHGVSTTVAVTVNMPTSSGVITVTPASINLNVPSGAITREYNYTLSVTGVTGKNFTAQVSQPWISVSPASGTIPLEVTLTIDVSNLVPGSVYTGTVSFITSHGASAEVSVTVNMEDASQGAGVLRASPSEIYLNVEVPAGGSTNQEDIIYSYSISVFGTPDVYFVASTDEPWITLPNGGSGQIPATITVEINVSQMVRIIGATEGTLTGTIEITDANGNVTTVTVHVTVRIIIADKLTVNPSRITLRVTRAMLSPQSFIVKLENANPERENFTWSSEILAPWLSLSPVQGNGSTSLVVTIDPSLMVAGNYCASYNAESGTYSTSNECPYPAGIIIFRSNIPAQTPQDATAILTVNVIVEPPNELAVFPSYLFWTVEIDEESGTIGELSSQILHIYAGAYGFSINYDVPWITTEFVNRPSDTDSGALSAAQAEGIFSITPLKDLLKSMGPGRYEGKITVWDRATFMYREIPIIVEIRKPGEPVSLPVPPPRFVQMTPGFVSVEATDANWLHMLLHVDDVKTYSSQSECSAAGGVWIDPLNGDASLGSGLPYCSVSEKVYVLLTAPQKQPGKVYAYTPTVPERFVLVYNNGTLVTGEQDPFFSVGSIPEADFGPMQLAGLKGQLFISVRVGQNISSSREVQQIQVNINSLEGYWLVSENYQGETYTYNSSRVLHLWFKDDLLGYNGLWGSTPVEVILGDGKTLLYRIEFVEQGIKYEYEITSLSASEMRGRWRFEYDGDYRSWETFQASRLSSALGTTPFQ